MIFQKLIALAGLAFLVSLPMDSFAQDADDILGLWLTDGGKSKVRVFKRGGKYYGKIIWLKEPYEDDGKTIKVDDENPDPALQSREIVGVEILQDLEWDGDEWDDGEIYDPESGSTYSCYAEFEDGQTDKLKIRGYIGFSLIGRTTYWTRLE